MKVNQKIMIGSLRINLISNSSIFQIGSTGLVQAYAKDMDEHYTILGGTSAGSQQAAGPDHPAFPDPCSDNTD